jgi:PAT family beta-lactamase induction signal transducer AmpG
MTLTNVVYLLLSLQQISDLRIISLLVFIQQAGYGLGFCALTFALTYFSGGHFRTIHYSICSGMMATSLMVPGIFSGWLQAELGYHRFFLLVLAVSIVTYIVTALVKIPSEFGKRQQR